MNLNQNINTPVRRLDTGIIEMKSSTSHKEKESMQSYARTHREILSLKPSRKKQYCETVFLSIDAEWVNKNKNANTQLSWQAAVLGTQSGSGDYLYENSIYYTKNNHRLTLSELTEAALQTIYPDISKLIRYYFSLKHCKSVLKTLGLSRSEKMRISRSLKCIDEKPYQGKRGLKIFKKDLQCRLTGDLWDSVKASISNLALQKPVLINLISHFSVAEWTMLVDRKSDELLNNFQSIRKTFYTKKPHQLTLSSGVLCEIHWFDTLLLAPSGYGQLEQLAKLLNEKSDEKIYIPPYYKNHMDELLETYPGKFRRYALRDTKITLKLFLVIQDMLNKLTFEQPRKLFKTIGSASVNRLLLFEDKDRILNLPPKIPKRKNIPAEELNEAKEKREVYYRHLPLVRACYHGGRNEGFFRGNTNDNPKSKNRVYFDFDFVSCYPTSMALLPRIDITKDPIHTAAYYQITPEIVSNLDFNFEKEPKQLKKIQALCQIEFPWSYQTHRNFKVPETASKQTNFDTSDRLDLILSNILEDNCQKQLIIKEILKRSLRFNDALINSWFSHWEKEKKAIEKVASEITQKEKKYLEEATDENTNKKKTLPDIPAIAKYQIMGYARVVFRFPSTALYPCLPMRHEKYGLIYPLSGESYATAPEIILAMEMIETENQNVKDKDKGYLHCLEAVEMATDPSPEADSNKVIFEYLVELVKERNKHCYVVRPMAEG
jgi:hypothetical protein